MFYRSCDSCKMNVTCVLLSKVIMHKMDCKQCHNIYLEVHVGLSVYVWWLININAYVGNK